MKTFSQLLSWFFHPILVPVFPVMVFLKNTTFFLEFDLQWQILRLVALLTIVFPLVVFWFLKLRGIVKGIELEKTRERLVPLVFYVGLLSLLIYRLYGAVELLELRMMFYGFLVSVVLALLAALGNFKVSLHVLFVSNVVGWLASFGVYSGVEIRFWLVGALLLTGALSSARLYLKAHKPVEVYAGFLFALVAHLVVFGFWG